MCARTLFTPNNEMKIYLIFFALLKNTYFAFCDRLTYQCTHSLTLHTYTSKTNERHNICMVNIGFTVVTKRALIALWHNFCCCYSLFFAHFFIAFSFVYHTNSLILFRSTFLSTAPLKSCRFLLL